MIIDMHSHIFPEKIASRALDKLSSIIKIPPSMNGTIFGLMDSMEKSGVDLSVVLPVVTSPSQFDSILHFAVWINETASSWNGPKLLSFGGIHPESSNYKEQLRSIAREGIRGIKIHPNYQGVSFDDIRYMRIIDTASELGLTVLTHAGEDAYTPGEEYCSPDMILHVLKDVAPPRLVLAHMGNNEHYNESEEKLCGQKVYLDTSYSIMHMSEEQFVRMIHIHGADRILFGTDAPWTSQKDCVQKLSRMTGLSQMEKQQILGGNASILLNL